MQSETCGSGELKYQRALFDRVMWDDIPEEEVRRVFGSDPMVFRELADGREVNSPLGTGVVYRCLTNSKRSVK